mmetsp:Transcript_95645/g.239654  ORF Transcript_95645/g.239654 Transcript_95645/m.239654 type:complete len:206 (-) Transcript_95645:143-760(-)
MPFLSCCDPSEEANQVSVDIDIATTDENLSYQLHDELPSVIPTLLVSQPAEKFGATRALKLKQLAAEAEDSWKDQLGVFSAASAAAGRKCTLLSEKTGARTEAEYVVDADLLQLTVRMASNFGQPEVLHSCPIMNIEDIFTVEDGEDCFPPRVMESLTSEEKGGLFMIVQSTHGPNTDFAKLCLVEASRADREDLLEHLKDMSYS